MKLECATSEVLELANNNNIHTWTGVSDSLGHYSWHKQELFKGRGGIGGTDWSGWNIEENWLGVNKISVSTAQGIEADDFKTNTVFYAQPREGEQVMRSSTPSPTASSSSCGNVR